MALAKGLQSADAEELVQEVFLAVSGALSQWLDREDRGAFRVWLIRIARKPSLFVAGGLDMLSLLLCGFLLTQNPAAPFSGGAKEESEVKFISSDEENFNQVVASLASSHGDWITNVTTQGIGKNDACSAILKSEGMEYFGVGGGYHQVPHPDHSIRTTIISWLAPNGY